MFKSLQARLILSYVVIIIVCLALVGLAALVLLRGYQRNLNLSRLQDRAVLAAGVTSQMLQRGISPQEAVRRLTRQLGQGDQPSVSVYLLDTAGRVIAGSGARLVDADLRQLAIRPLPPPGQPARGESRLATGERLLYVAETLRSTDEQGQRSTPYILFLAEPYRPLRFALGDLVPRLVWAGVIALGLSVVLAALTAYSIARPLEHIAQAAEEVAAGNFEQQLEISAPAEVARLAVSFNSMARQVQTMLDSQQDLVANVSHELKTPLTSILGFSQALLDGTVSDPAARQRAVSVIHEEAGRMRRLVDDLLDLARLEAGQVTLARKPVDVAELLHACAARFAPQAEQLGSSLLLEVSPSLPVLMGDADRLGQVFDNVVDNALKHTRDVAEGGRVVLRAESQDQRLYCSVTDNGSGIPADDLQRVFERFYQVDKSRARRDRGVGLGLAIAQEIVEAHGGQIRAESVEGLGTRVTVELPALQR